MEVSVKKAGRARDGCDIFSCQHVLLVISGRSVWSVTEVSSMQKLLRTKVQVLRVPVYPD
jgi:hypothetical protein